MSNVLTPLAVPTAVQPPQPPSPASSTDQRLIASSMFLPVTVTLNTTLASWIATHTPSSTSNSPDGGSSTVPTSQFAGSYSATMDRIRTAHSAFQQPWGTALSRGMSIGGGTAAYTSIDGPGGPGSGMGRDDDGGCFIYRPDPLADESAHMHRRRVSKKHRQTVSADLRKGIVEEGVGGAGPSGDLESSSYGEQESTLLDKNESPIDLPSDSEAEPMSNKTWKFGARSGYSAMYSGIHSLKPTHDLIHIAWTGPISDSSGALIDPATLPADLIEDLKKQLWEEHRMVPVIVPDGVAGGAYEGYCKTHLYPLLHYVLMDIDFDGAAENRNWFDYVALSKKFAETIAEHANDGDLVWLHDYHLFLVPSLLRDLKPSVTIGFFLHTPFPSSEIFRCGPRRKEILEGLLGSNLVGFQTYAYARHFISSCTRVLGLESTPRGVEYNGNLVEVRIVPVGIDVGKVERRRKTAAVMEKMQSIREMYPGKKIVVGRDKLDQVKGVAHKLASFEKFLRLYPEFQNKVVLIQVTTPPQTEIPRLEAKFSELVARINGHFGSLEFAPVHHYHQLHLDRDEYFALLSIADVGLVTALRDGMNTSSHEFIVCQQDNKSPLILSEFTGTAGSLGSSIMVNPWDHLGVANALYEALTMSEQDKIARHGQLYSHVASQTAQVWAQQFVTELRACEQSAELLGPTPTVRPSVVLRNFRESKRRLLVFDYDGTLTNIRKTPGEAVPPPRMLEALSTLIADPTNYVFVVSGRDRPALETWLGNIPGLGLCAEHGCFIRWPGEYEWIDVTQEVGLDLSWKDDVKKIFDYYTERTQGSFVELKSCAVTWHYRLSDPDFGSFQAKECQNHLESAILSKLPVDIMLGKKNLEVRPSMINKGEMVKRLLSRVTEEYDFIMCAGDDRTDEDMFKAIKTNVEPTDHVFTIQIGDAAQRTQAMYRLPTPDSLINVLVQMADVSRQQARQRAAEKAANL